MRGPDPPTPSPNRKGGAGGEEKKGLEIINLLNKQI